MLRVEAVDLILSPVQVACNAQVVGEDGTGRRSGAGLQKPGRRSKCHPNGRQLGKTERWNVLYVADSTRTLFFVNVHTSPPGVLMAKIVVFSTAGCQHCSKAKALLAGKGALCEHTAFLQESRSFFFSFLLPHFTFHIVPFHGC